MRRNSQKSKRITLIIFIIIFVGLIGAVGYLYTTNRDLRYELSLSDQDRTRLRNEELLADIGKLISLPDEEPVIVLVNDPTKAEEENPGIEAIFDSLQKNDYILIFKKAKLGVQYRPSEAKIIKSTTVTLPIVVEIIGAQKAIDAMINSLEQFGNRITIVQTINDTITDSAIYDVDNNQPTEVQSLDTLLKYGVANTLPNTVKASDQAEIVILVSTTPTTTEQTQP